MARLFYSATMSLDGYINDPSGGIDWTAPDERLHAFVNDRERSIGTYLFGRRLYDVMKVWEEIPSMPDQSPVMLDYADIWRNIDKIVYSRTLQTASTPRTRVERVFDPDAIAGLKKDADGDLSIGGPTLAAAAIAAGLVDEYRVFVSPTLVGGGTAFFPDDVRLKLELLEERRFDNGVVYLTYRPLD